MKSAIGFKQVVESLHQHGAPEKVGTAGRNNNIRTAQEALILVLAATFASLKVGRHEGSCCSDKNLV